MTETYIKANLNGRASENLTALVVAKGKRRYRMTAAQVALFSLGYGGMRGGPHMARTGGRVGAVLRHAHVGDARPGARGAGEIVSAERAA